MINILKPYPNRGRIISYFWCETFFPGFKNHFEQFWRCHFKVRIKKLYFQFYSYLSVLFIRDVLFTSISKFFTSVKVAECIWREVSNKKYESLVLLVSQFNRKTFFSVSKVILNSVGILPFSNFLVQNGITFLIDIGSWSTSSFIIFVTNVYG